MVYCKRRLLFQRPNASDIKKYSMFAYSNIWVRISEPCENYVNDSGSNFIKSFKKILTIKYFIAVYNKFMHHNSC